MLSFLYITYQKGTGFFYILHINKELSSFIYYISKRNSVLSYITYKKGTEFLPETRIF